MFDVNSVDLMGDLSDEALALALVGATPENDGAKKPEEPAAKADAATPVDDGKNPEIKEPEKAPEEKEAPVEAKQEEVKEELADPADPAWTPDPSLKIEGVLSRSGKYVISMEKLDEAREKARTESEARTIAETQLNETKAELARLQALQAEKKEEIEAHAEESVDGLLKEEILEALDEDYEGLGKAIRLVLQKNAALEKEVSTFKQETIDHSNQSAWDAHFNAITTAHPDYKEKLESVQMKEWLQGMPRIAREGYINTFTKGDAQSIVEGLNDFDAHIETSTKKASGKKETLSAEEVSKRAAAAEKKASESGDAPGSLTEVPGSAPFHDEQEALLNMGLGNLMDMMSGKNVEDQFRIMDKMIGG